MDKSRRGCDNRKRCSDHNPKEPPSFSTRIHLEFQSIPSKQTFLTLCTKDQKIISSELISSLVDGSLLKEGDNVSYWDSSKESFVYWCQVGNQTVINLSQNLIVGNQLKLRVRKNKRPFVESLIEEQNRQLEEIPPKSSKKKEVSSSKRISDVVRKVSLWRMLYLGFESFDGQYVKKPLDIAASQVGIAKKTLDDYLLNIRNGRQAGFDFNSKKDGGIGELREFVKARKKCKPS